MHDAPAEDPKRQARTLWKGRPERSPSTSAHGDADVVRRITAMLPLELELVVLGFCESLLRMCVMNG